MLDRPAVRRAIAVCVWTTCACLTVPASTNQTPSSDTQSNDKSTQHTEQNTSADADRQDGDRQQDDQTDNNQDDDIEAQLDAIEREVTGQASGDDGTETSQGRSRRTSGSPTAQTALNPELSVILDTGFAVLENDPDLVGGPDPKEFGPFLQSLELALQADVDPYFTFDAHLITNLDGINIGEAYVTTLALPAKLQARMGKFKTAFGRVNPVHLHAWHFTALPLANGIFLGPAGLNGVGAEISQILPLPWFAQWRVALQDLSGAPTGRSFLRQRDRFDEVTDLVVSARLEQFGELSGDWDLLWGLSGAFGRNDSGAGSSPGADAAVSDAHASGIYGTDILLKYKPAAKGGRLEAGWQTEAMLRDRDTPDGRLVDAGGYSYLYLQPNRNWEFGTRYEYVSDLLRGTDDYLTEQPRDSRHRAGVSVASMPSNFSRFRLEYMAGRLSAGLDDFSHSVLLQAQFVTGAHGAHTY